MILSTAALIVTLVGCKRGKEREGEEKRGRDEGKEIGGEGTIRIIKFSVKQPMTD